MKKIILSTILIAFAVAANAGDSKDCGSCCSSKATTQQTKASTKEKMACSKNSNGTKTALLSPKAAGEKTTKS